jgi:hypothetical protein
MDWLDAGAPVQADDSVNCQPGECVPKLLPDDPQWRAVCVLCSYHWPREPDDEEPQAA